MDVDYLNSPTEAQMDLVTMMMQMEKFPNFFSSSDSPPPPPFALEFSGDGGAPPEPPQFYTTTPPTTLFPPTAFYSGDTSPAAEAPYYYGAAAEMSSSGVRREASMAAMREMIFRIAAMQPVHIDPEAVKPPRRRNVRISKDPQSVAARHRRERISERIRILQRLVPGGTKMDTASMLDEAIHYVKFLKTQVQSLERVATAGLRLSPPVSAASGVAAATAALGGGDHYLCFGNAPTQMTS